MKCESKITKKPWGYEELLFLTKNYALKRLVVRQGERLSLQYHKRKEESWLVEKGSIHLDINGLYYFASEGDLFHIPAGTSHRITANSDCSIIEVSTIELDDIVRQEDDYGRT